MSDSKKKAIDAPKVGRPVHIAEFAEGKEAASTFERAMKAIISVPREVILEAETGSNKPTTGN